MADLSDDVRHARAVRTVLELTQGSPEKRLERQLLFLEDVRAACLRDFGSLPAWWNELRDEVEARKL